MASYKVITKTYFCDLYQNYLQMHQSDFVAQQENMNFAKTLLILVIFWQFCDATEVTKKLKKQVKKLKTKYDSIKLFMGMYIRSDTMKPK